MTSDSETPPADVLGAEALTSTPPLGSAPSVTWFEDFVREAAPQQSAPYDARYHFTRIQFSATRRGFGGWGGRGGAQWAHDYPRADRNFLAILNETTFIDTSRELSTIVSLEDPELFNNPITYLVEPGFWQPSPEAIENLRNYLLKGGFLIIDDFRGPRELDNLEFYLMQALPELRMLEIDSSHEIFDTFFRVDPEGLLPPYGGYPPAYYGIFEDNDPSKRMMVMINANNDIAEYWEFSDYGYYGIDLSNEAYKVGVNYVVYALTH
ncbi:MAG: DUF4159 domain-containing protein [Gemmatimonadota bacterium]